MKFNILKTILISSVVFCNTDDNELKTKKIPSITRDIEDGVAVYRDSNDNRVLFYCEPREENDHCSPVTVLLDDKDVVVQNNEGLILYRLKTNSDGNTIAETNDRVVFCNKNINENKTVSYTSNDQRLFANIKIVDENHIVITDYTTAKPSKIDISKNNEIIKLSSDNTIDVLLTLNENTLCSFINNDKDKVFKVVFKCFETGNENEKLFTIAEVLLLLIIRLSN